MMVDAMLEPFHAHLQETHDRLQGLLAAEPVSLSDLIRSYLR